MLAALVAGERNPKVLAQLARRSMRAKITAVLEEAFTGHFTGHFTDHHAFLLARMLARGRRDQHRHRRPGHQDRGGGCPFRGCRWPG